MAGHVPDGRCKLQIRSGRKQQSGGGTLGINVLWKDWRQRAAEAREDPRSQELDDEAGDYDETAVEPDDVKLIMTVVQCSRSQAVGALHTTSVRDALAAFKVARWGMSRLGFHGLAALSDLPAAIRTGDGAAVVAAAVKAMNIEEIQF